MTHFDTATPTSSHDDEGPRQPGFTVDLNRLRDHLRECRIGHRRWFTLELQAEVVHRYLSARLVTTALVAGLLLALAALVS